jgi:hypothetical protein
MKLKRFIIKNASRAELLTSQVPSEVIQTIKQLDDKDVRRLLKDFVPLDFVALIQHHNPTAFQRAIVSMLGAILSSNQYKTWIDTMGIDKLDAIQQAYALMLNKDPRKRGILTQIALDGSSSPSFQYVPKDQPQTRLDLKSSVAPIGNANAIQVPHCPVDQKIGIKHPLWSLSIEEGEVEIEEGVDKNGRCTQAESIGEMSEEDFIILEQNQDALTRAQEQQIKSGQRELVYVEGEAFLRCTFHAKLNRFQSFLHSRALATVSSLIDAYRKERGITITSKQFQELNALQQKERDGTLNEEEALRLKNLKDLISKKSSESFKSTSLDQFKGDDDETSLHETVGENIDVDDQSAREALFELERALPQSQFETLLEVVHKVPLSGVLMLLQRAHQLPNKDPKRAELLSQVPNETQKVAQAYFNSSSSKRVVSECKTCLSSVESSESCPFAREMRLNIYATYDTVNSLGQFSSKLKLSDKAQKHYEQSNLEPILNRAYAGLEVEEPDLDIDFSIFKGEVEVVHSKLTSEELKKQINLELSGTQKKAFEGTDLIQQEEEVNEEEIEKIDKLSNFLQKILHEIFTQELDKELGTYLIHAGAQ